MIRFVLAAAIALAAHPSVMYAGHCNVQQQRVIVHKQAVQAYVAPQVVHHAQQAVVNYGHAAQLQHVYPQQYYSVGAQIQEEAATARVASYVKGQAKEILREALGELLQEIKQTNRREPGPGDGFEHPGQKLAAVKCATCHMQGSKLTSRAENPIPVLFNGLGEFVGNQTQAAHAIDEAQAGRMPPPDENNPGAVKELTTSEFIVLQDYLTKFAPSEQ